MSLGAQEHGSIQAVLNIPVASIEPRAYALADGDKVLSQVLKMIEENTNG